MKALPRSAMLAMIHALILSSVAGILLIERAMYPRVWVRTARVDFQTPPRGRYVRLRVEAEADRTLSGREVTLSMRGNALIASPAALPTGLRLVPKARSVDGTDPVLPLEVDPPLTIFLPAQLTVPWPRPADEEVWAEVTVPPSGLPRLIRLGLKKNGILTPF